MNRAQKDLCYFCKIILITVIIYNINVNQQFESDDEEENNEEYSKRMRAKPKKLMNQQFTLSQSKAKMQKLAKNDEINLGIMKNSERQQTRTTLKTFQIKTQLQFEQSPKNPLQYLSGKIAIPISQISFPSLQPK